MTKPLRGAVFGSALLVILSVFWLLSTYLSVRHEFGARDIWIIGGVVAGVLAVETLALLGGAWLFKRLWLVVMLAGGFVAVSAFCLNVVMNPQIVALGKPLLGLLMLAGFGIACMVVLMTTESRALGIGVVLLVGLGTGTSLLLQLQAIRPNPAAGATEMGSPMIIPVTFVERPNVYFLGIESMQPSSILKDHLGIEQPVEAVMEANNFRVFRNLFSEGNSTSNALHLILGQEFEYFYEMQHQGITGIVPTPLLQEFRVNGYEVNTLYPLSYFGQTKGPYVDRYITFIPYTVCSFMLPYEERFAFFGVCGFLRNVNARALAGYVDTGALIVDTIEDLASRETPQMLFAHIYPPDHTGGDYLGTEENKARFREVYLAGTRQAARNVQRVVDTLKRVDPTALLFVFGDHGIWLSRQMQLADDPRFVMLDRYAVLGGVYPGGACASSLDAPFSVGYVTTPEVARLLVRCLAGGVDPFIAPRIYEKNIDGIPFADYLYE